ncbi:MAG: hypothetical protein ACPIOQ_18265, partial [Promethearchaeia archaeon]
MEFGGGQQERSAVPPLRQEVLENLNALLEAVCVAYFLLEFAVQLSAFGRSFLYRWEQRFGV